MNQIKYPRYLKEQIQSWLFGGKVIIIYGARQVGKTTISKEISLQVPDSLYLNCETINIHDLLESKNLERIKAYIGNSKMVVLDEAQKIKDIGLVLKLMHDTWPDLQIIATGSSSFNLLNELSEPLTGRNVKFLLYPLSFYEMNQVHHISILEEKLEQLLIYGMYPDIVDRPDSQKITILEEISSDYLFRDVLQFENLKRPDIIRNLLKALALQLGNEVSARELSLLLKVSIETIKRYIEVLERSFILFRLGSFSRNLRKEISRNQKFYFYDLGLRNSLLQNYAGLSNRNDIGALWENFCMIERMKANQHKQRKVNMYFWRTFDQKEIDLIEESNGILEAFEFKYNPEARVKIPKEFLETYQGSKFQLIHTKDYLPFILP